MYAENQDSLHQLNVRQMEEQNERKSDKSVVWWVRSQASLSANRAKLNSASAKHALPSHQQGCVVGDG